MGHLESQINCIQTEANGDSKGGGGGTDTVDSLAESRIFQDERRPPTTTRVSQLKEDMEQCLKPKIKTVSLKPLGRCVTDAKHFKATAGDKFSIGLPALVPKVSETSNFPDQGRRGGFDQLYGSSDNLKGRSTMKKRATSISTMEQGLFVPRETSKVQLRKTSFKPSLLTKQSAGIRVIRGRQGKA